MLRHALALLVALSGCASPVSGASPPDGGDPSTTTPDVDVAAVMPTVADPMHEGVESGLCSHWEAGLVDASVLTSLRSGAEIVQGIQGGFSIVSWRDNPAPDIGGVTIDTNGAVRNGLLELAVEPRASVIQAIGLADGSFAVEWARETPGAPGTDSAYLARYDATGTIVARSNELTMDDSLRTTWIGAGATEDQLVVAAERGAIGVGSWSWLSFPLDAGELDPRARIPVTDFDEPVVLRDDTLLTLGWHDEGVERTSILRAWNAHGERTMSFDVAPYVLWQGVPMDLGHDDASVVMADSTALRILREGSILEVPADVQMPFASAAAGPIDDSATIAYASDRYDENGGQPVLSIFDVSASGTRGPIGTMPLTSNDVIDLSVGNRAGLVLATDVERDAHLLLLITPVAQYAAVMRCTERDP